MRSYGRLGIAPRGDGDNEISLLFPNGSRIVGLPGTESTVRGFSAVSLMLIDEAARVSESYMAVRPMLAVGDGDLWLMSTPFGKRGFFWEAWEKGGTVGESFGAGDGVPSDSRELSGGRTGGVGGALVPAGVSGEFVDAACAFSAGAVDGR